MSTTTTTPTHVQNKPGMMKKLTIPGDSWKSRARFYDTVDVMKMPDSRQGGCCSWAITLDGRVLKTPNHHPFLLPSKPLAGLIAHEWDCQIKFLETSTMPLTLLSATSIEVTSVKRPAIVNEMLRFLVTDLICFPVVVTANSTMITEDDQLICARQELYWSRPLTHFLNRYGHLDRKNALITPQHPESTMEAVRNRLINMSNWELTAVHHLAQGCKSLVIPLALLDGAITSKEALDAARVEEAHQIEQWGLVEGGHDVELANMRLQIASASLLAALTREMKV